MWTTQNYTPFAVGGSFACDKLGRKLWVVAIRASFSITEAGRLVRSPEQVAVSRGPRFEGEPAASSLLYDSDFPYTKLGTDVVLNVHAYAPAGRPSEAVDVGFQVGSMRKVLRVHGDRVWSPALLGPVPTRALPFVSRPIRYEHAFGGAIAGAAGFWPANPIGRGYASDAAALIGQPVPNVEDPADPLRDANTRPRRVAGFGAIPGHWVQRARLAGTYDERWKRERAPLWPEDFDPRYFQVAPVDQQASGFLSGGEPCTLRNLTPSGSSRFVLPKLRIHVATQFADGDEQRTDARLHTVVIESEPPRLTLVWHTALPCHDREQLIQRSLVRWEGERSWVEAPRSTSMI